MRIGQLLSEEIDAFITLLDQIAGWRSFRALSQSERRRFIERECKSAVPNVLLRLLESNYVRDKYREEYNKSSHVNSRERSMIIAALLLANIGLDAPTSFLSEVFELDFLLFIKRMSEESGTLKLVRADRDFVYTVPSIGARNLLRNVIDMREIVNTTIYILEKMAEGTRRRDWEAHIFTQLMRYSILSSVVSDAAEIDRFFDHISKIAYFRSMPLFWLQWHMAMSAQGSWLKAEEYLEMGYTAAAAYEKRRGEPFNKKQLDDRKAKFLAERADSIMRSGSELFRDLKEASDIVRRLLADAELTHHPYETLSGIVKSFRSKESILLEAQRRLVVDNLKAAVDLGSRRINLVPDGYQRSQATECLNQIKAVGVL